jgi:hypothetical protein
MNEKGKKMSNVTNTQQELVEKMLEQMEPEIMKLSKEDCFCFMFTFPSHLGWRRKPGFFNNKVRYWFGCEAYETIGWGRLLEEELQRRFGFYTRLGIVAHVSFVFWTISGAGCLDRPQRARPSILACREGKPQSHGSDFTTGGVDIPCVVA